MYLWLDHESMFNERVFFDDGVDVAAGESRAELHARGGSERPFRLAVQRVDRDAARNVDRLSHVFDVFQRTLQFQLSSACFQPVLLFSATCLPKKTG